MPTEAELDAACDINLYKCRACGAVFRDKPRYRWERKGRSHEEMLMVAASHAYPPCSLMPHHCSDRRSGLADFVGIEFADDGEGE